jgi:hypothetical protein
MEKRKTFAAYTAGEARKAASDWLHNFKDHGPLEIRSIRVTENRDVFTATVYYAEMAVEETPQYFPDYRPIYRSV